MSDTSDIQRISLEILRDPSKARQHGHLDLLELEDRKLSQLHPLAQVIALHERGSTARISKTMLQNAAKTILLSGSCEMCEEEESDDWDLTYYEIKKMGRGAISSMCYIDTISDKQIWAEFQLAYEMQGGSMDGFTAAKTKVSMARKDLTVAVELIKTFGRDQKWLERLLSAKSNISSSLDPGFDNLDGLATISLEAVSLSIDDRVLTTLLAPETTVAEFQYSAGELDETKIYLPMKEASDSGETCFWPSWLPAVADELVLQIKAYYRDRLASESAEGVIRDIEDALSSVDALCRDDTRPYLHLQVEELIDFGHCRSPAFWGVSFDISKKKWLPPGFNAQADVGVDCLRVLLLKLAEVDAFFS